MEDILKFNTITEYNTLNNTKTLNPLVSLIHFENAEPRKLRRMYYGFYAIFLKQVKCGDLRYGLNYYDYQEGTMIFLAPGQVIGENGDDLYQPQGYALVFHPDLLRGTTLGKTIEDYSFFSYASNESLHLSDQEKEIILESFSKIEFEIAHAIDKHSKKLIVSNIELLLNYCMRFYDRQFITRENTHKGSLERFEFYSEIIFSRINLKILVYPLWVISPINYIYQRIISEICLKKKPVKPSKNISL